MIAILEVSRIGEHSPKEHQSYITCKFDTVLAYDVEYDLSSCTFVRVAIEIITLPFP